MRFRYTISLVFLWSISFSQTFEKGKKYWQDRNFPAAKQQLKTIKKESKDFAAAQFYLGRIAYEEKEYEVAVEYFETAIDANEKVSEYHNWLGNALASTIGEANFLRQAIIASKMKSAWEKAIELDPKAIDPRESLIQYYLQAPAVAGGSVEKAKAMANEIKKLKPALGYLQLGNIYSREKNFVAAEKEFIAMAKADPAYTPGLTNFYINQKQYDKAFALFDEQLKKNPEDMMATYQVGKTSALSGQQLDRGEACLKKYLAYQPKTNEPSHAGATMRLAQILEKRGDKAEAKKLYQAALRSDATLKEAKDGLDRVSK